MFCKCVEHGLFEGVNTSFGTIGYVGEAAAHGVVGGTFAVVNGGEFSAGFLAAGFSSAAGPINIGVGGGRNVVLHAMLGGTGSVLGGGKFQDGAVTGSFEYLFNQAGMGHNGGPPLDEELDPAAPQRPKPSLLLRVASRFLR